MWLALRSTACGHRTATPMDEQGKNNRDPEVEKQITLLETPFGDGPHQRERATRGGVAGRERRPRLPADYDPYGRGAR